MLQKSETLNPPPGFHPAVESPVSDIEAGLDLNAMPKGAAAEVETRHTTYRFEYLGDGKAVISGHPQFCPEPVVVDLFGSVLGGQTKVLVVQPGMKMLFSHPSFGVVSTSRVLRVHELTVH